MVVIVDVAMGRTNEMLTTVTTPRFGRWRHLLHFRHFYIYYTQGDICSGYPIQVMVQRVCTTAARDIPNHVVRGIVGRSRHGTEGHGRVR